MSHQSSMMVSARFLGRCAAIKIEDTSGRKSSKELLRARSKKTAISNLGRFC
jgi:hypothetical protein